MEYQHVNHNHESLPRTLHSLPLRTCRDRTWRKLLGKHMQYHVNPETCHLPLAPTPFPSCSHTSTRSHHVWGMHQIAKEDSNENHRHHATWKLAHQVKLAWNHVCWTLTKQSVGRSNGSSSIAKPKLYPDSYVGEKIIQKIGTIPHLQALATAVCFYPKTA